MRRGLYNTRYSSVAVGKEFTRRPNMLHCIEDYEKEKMDGGSLIDSLNDDDDDREKKWTQHAILMNFSFCSIAISKGSI